MSLNTLIIAYNQQKLASGDMSPADYINEAAHHAAIDAELSREARDRGSLVGAVYHQNEARLMSAEALRLEKLCHE